MSQQISLKEAERKAFKTKVDDGLWDILVGSYFLLFVMALYLSPRLGDFWSSAVIIPVIGLIFLVIWLIRKYIITPRLGIVKFGHMRTTKLMKFTIIMLIFNVLAFIGGIVVAMNFGKAPGQMYPIIFGMLLLIFFSIAAYFLDFNRLFIYGLLLGLSPLVGEWLWNHGHASHHGFPVTFGTSAGIMILTGLVVFFRLLHNNPLPKEMNLSEDA
jgi:MFS family permease